MNLTPKQLRFHLFCNWTLRSQTLADYVDERVNFLHRLMGLHSIFRQGLYMVSGTRKDSPALAPDLSNVETFMLREARTRDCDERWFTDLDGKGNTTRRTTSELGFMLWIRSLDHAEEHQLRIEFNGGSTRPNKGGGTSIRLPYSAPPELLEPNFLRDLLLLMIDFWKPEQAGIYNHAVSDVVTIENSYETPISWMNYLDDTRVAEVLPVDVLHEPVGSGVLFSLQPEPPLTAATIETAIRKAQRTRDALQPGEWMTPRAWRGKKPLHAPMSA